MSSPYPALRHSTNSMPRLYLLTSTVKPPTRKSTRDRTQINYNELNEGLAVEEHRFTKILNAREFAPDEFERMEGKDVTMEWARRTGMRRPILIEMPNGLDMAMPDNTLTVSSY